MTSVCFALLAFSGWGTGGCGPGGCGPQPMFAPQWSQPAPWMIAPPVYQPAPVDPLANGVSELYKAAAVEGDVKSIITRRSDLGNAYVVITLTDGREFQPGYGVVKYDGNPAKFDGSTKYEGGLHAKISLNSVGDVVAVDFSTVTPKSSTGKKCDNGECDCKDCGNPSNPPNELGKKSPLCYCKECRCSKCTCNTVDEKPRGKVDAEAFSDDDTKMPNMGIDLQKMRERGGKQRYSTNGGRELSKEQAYETMAGDGTVPDDSNLMFFTVLGNDSQCKLVENDVKTAPAFDGLRDKLRFKAYQPTDSMVKDKGFVAGDPAVYLQDAKGKVLARWESYPGAAPVAGEVNKRRPDYDPNKDPQPLKPSPSPIPLPSLSSINPWYVAGALALLLLLKSPTQQPAPAK